MEYSVRDIFYFFFIVVFVGSSFLFENKIRFFLIAMIAFFPFEAGYIFYHYHGFMLMDLPLLSLIFIGLITGKKFKLYIPYLGLPLLLFFAWSMAGVINTWMPGYVISDSMRLFRGYLIIICLVNFTKTPKDLKLVITALFGGLLFQALLGVYQWRFGPMGLRILGEVTWVSWRSQGTFQHESYYGNYLAFLTPIVYRLFVFYKARSKKENIRYGFLFAISALALFTSFTRGPWIAFAFAIVAMTIWSLHKKKLRPKKLLPMSLILIFGLVFFIRYTPSILAQFDSESGRMIAAKIRIPLNRIAIRMIKKYPLMGVGQGMYLEYAPGFVHDQEEGVADWEIDQLKTDMVHNSYLKSAAETGIPLLLLFLWYIFAIYWIGIKNIKSVDPFLANFSIGALTGYTALFVSFMASPDFRIHQINVLIWLLGGILISIHNLNKKYQKFIIYQKQKELEDTSVLSS